jgi:hypothetical protein
VEPAETVIVWNDLAAAARHKAVHSRVWLGLVPVCLGLAALTVIVPFAVLRVMGALLVVYVATIPLWGPTMATWLQARRRAWPDSPTSWLPTPDGLSISSDAGQSTLPWASLSKVSSWRRGVSMTRGRAVVFVPARAFSGEEHRSSFVTAVEGHVAPGRG